jgi:hypothetical protein
VRLKTWADRIGKTLAFLRLDLREEGTGRLVAVGKHCKYLPMGIPFWDAAFNPGLYPILRCVCVCVCVSFLCCFVALLFLCVLGGGGGG